LQNYYFKFEKKKRFSATTKKRKGKQKSAGETKKYININQEINIRIIINKKITNIILILVFQEIYRYQKSTEFLLKQFPF
jgi:hypothetical protein